MKRKLIKILIAIVLLVVLLIVGGIIILNKLSESASQIAVLDLDVSTIPDGVHYGEYSISPVTVKTKLHVKNGELEEIELLEHANGLGESAESIIYQIIEQQSLAVDTISGATVSSKCILKAVENALLSAKERN